VIYSRLSGTFQTAFSIGKKAGEVYLGRSGNNLTLRDLVVTTAQNLVDLLSRTRASQLAGLVESSSPAAADLLLLERSSDGALRKVQRSNIALAPGEHRLIDELTHNLDESYYWENTYDAAHRVTDSIIWTDSGKTLKIREYNYSYSGGKISQAVTKQYNSVGTLVETLTETFSWSGPEVSNITCVRS
jgi:hypothetical protein